MKRKPPLPRRAAAPKRAAPTVGIPKPTVASPLVKSPLEARADEAVSKAANLFAVQEFKAAKKILDDVIQHVPKHAVAYQLRSQVLSRGMLKPEAAEADLAASLAILGADPRTLRLKSELMFRMGRADEAVATARAALAADPTEGDAYRIIEKVSSKALTDEDVAQMTRIADDTTVAPQRRRIMHHVLARLADRRGAHSEAFDRYQRGNALLEGNYNADADAADLASLRANWPTSFFDQRRGWGMKDAKNVFMVGMPRSGSTLVEQAITAHPKVDSGGETNALAKIERLLIDRYPDSAAKNRRRFPFLDAITKADSRLAAHKYQPLVEAHFSRRNPFKILDKTLVNFIRIPFILLLFPNSTILHTFRDPLDTAFSCFQQSFTNTDFALRLEWIAQYWTNYCACMDFWEDIAPGRIIHVCHEDLVTNFDTRIREVVAHCGLDWDDRCAKPHENDRFVYTASAGQVSKPVNTGSFGKWRRYEQELAPLIDAMGGREAVLARHETFRTRAAGQFSVPV